MASIPNLAVSDAYTLARRVFDQQISLTYAITWLAKNYPINKGSASDYISNFRYMMEGRRFTRTLNEFSMRYYFERITDEFLPEVLSKALIALMAHIEYYEAVQARLGRVTIMRTNRLIYDEYRQLLPVALRDNMLQIDLEKLVDRTQTRADIIRDLQNLKETDPTTVIISGITYSRDSKTIAQIKILRGFKCQLCGIQIPKKNGGFYIEAAHITPKRLRGRETPDNIIILCPNHHKEFDFGDVRTITRSPNQVSFLMNGVQHTIDLALR